MAKPVKAHLKYGSNCVDLKYMSSVRLVSAGWQSIVDVFIVFQSERVGLRVEFLFRRRFCLFSFNFSSFSLN